MKKSLLVNLSNALRQWIGVGFIAVLFVVAGCADDPAPVNEEELITTAIVELTPLTGGNTITLRYYDEDGIGSIAPVTTISGPLAANNEYTGVVTFLNETENPAEDITEEIEEEANDHLLCYTVTNLNAEIESIDSDDNARPIGLATLWSTGSVSSGNVVITLRHQPGTKTGVCPGSGDTDIEVNFAVTIQ